MTNDVLKVLKQELEKAEQEVAQARTIQERGEELILQLKGALGALTGMPLPAASTPNAVSVGREPRKHGRALMPSVAEFLQGLNGMASTGSGNAGSATPGEIARGIIHLKKKNETWAQFYNTVTASLRAATLTSKPRFRRTRQGRYTLIPSEQKIK